VCNGIGQDIVIEKIVCPNCRGTKAYTSAKSNTIVDCNRCNEDGTIMNITYPKCSFCKGTGIRIWTDKILRPVPVQCAEDKEL